MSETLLSEAKQGKKLKIVRLESGKHMESRLIGMGLPIGSKLEILQRQNHGPIVISVGDARLGIGAGMASKIIVVEV